MSSARKVVNAEDYHRLREAFVDLLDEARDMRSYVPDYFAVKWHHDEALERAAAALKEASS